MQLVTARGVNKTYKLDSVDVPALVDVSLEIFSNRFTVISGPSGSGKSTLLNLIGGIDPPDSGEVWVDGARVYVLNDDELSDFRSRTIGVVFQNFNLLPVLTTFENVEYPLIISRVPKRERAARVNDLLRAVGLAEKAQQFPGQLSGGQRQRVAIARALVSSPKLVLADEPTANLDSRTSASILALMRALQQDRQTAFVIASHDPRVIAEADDHVSVADGKVTSVVRNDTSIGDHAHEDALAGA